jgi:glycogen synthase
VPASPPRIVFALVGDVRGSTRALRQLRWLAEAGYPVDVLTFGPPAEPGVVATSIRLHVLERPAGGGPRFFWRAHRIFRAAARSLRADVYHASDLYTLPALAAAARAHGGRLVYDSRELYPHVDATAGKPWARWAWAAVERTHIRRCDAVLTVNPSIAERLARSYGIEDPVVVYNLAVRQAPPGGEALRQRLGIAAGRPIVLYQGLLRAGRGIEALLTAMTSVPEADLVLVGDGPMRSHAEELAARSGGHHHVLPFTPPDELLPLTASADVGVCILEPVSESVRLALPNKLFEYLGAGLPVVVSDMPEMRRVVETFDVGLVVPHDDSQVLAAALRRALTDTESRVRWRANIPRVFETFDPEEDRRRFLGVYEGLMG